MTEESYLPEAREAGTPIAQRPAILFGIPVLLAAVAYLTALPAGFVLDDYHFLLGNDAVTGGVHLPLFQAIATEGGAFYRPLPVFLMSVEHALWGASPFGYHLVSVLLHLAATAAVVALARRLAGARAALWAGALFAVHPVHVEVVACIANRSEVLATLFVVLAWLAFLRHGDSRSEGTNDGDPAPFGRRYGPLVAMNAWALLALLCKESAFTLPLGLGALGLWRRPRQPWAPLFCIPALLAALALRHGVFEGIAGVRQHDVFAEALHAKWFTVVRGIATYGELLVAPTTQLASYAPPAYPFVEGITGAVVVGALVVLAVAVAALWGLRSPQAGSLGLVLLVATISPYLHLIPFSVIIAERFLYLPSVGFCLAAGWLIARTRDAVDRPGLVVVAAVLWIASLGALTANRNLDWNDPVRLWGADVETAGGSTLARANLGVSLWQVERYEEAVEHLRWAVEQEPWQEAWVVSLARMYRAVGLIEESMSVARRGLEWRPESAELQRLATPD